MTTTAFDHLREAAKKLPEPERRQLVLELQDTLDVEDDGEDEIHPAWRAEIERRVADIDAGVASFKPAAVVIAEIRAKFAK